jgi:hypothetical protein
MNFINSEKLNVGQTQADINNQLEQARRQGIRDVVYYLMSYKPTMPWGESVAKHFGIDLKEVLDVSNTYGKGVNQISFLTHEQQEEAYLKATGLTKDQYDSITSNHERPVHCDARIIHKPGECKYCDQYGTKQQDNRIKYRVCFTNHTPESETSGYYIHPCPAMFARGETVNSWHGNVAVKE